MEIFISKSDEKYFNKTRLFTLNDINKNIMCKICMGYLIDATTIIECLHSFCKSCLINHLKLSNKCPLCECLIHKTKPTINIRNDITLQELVFKLIPGLYNEEKHRRKEFYLKSKKKIKGKLEKQSWLNLGTEKHYDLDIYSVEDDINVQLSYLIRDPESPEEFNAIEKALVDYKRYLQCSITTNILTLRKFLQKKFSIPLIEQIDIFCANQCLVDNQTLLDLVCSNSLNRLDPLEITFYIHEIYIEEDEIPEKYKDNNGIVNHGNENQPYGSTDQVSRKTSSDLSTKSTLSKNTGNIDTPKKTQRPVSHKSGRKLVTLKSNLSSHKKTSSKTKRKGSLTDASNTNAVNSLTSEEESNIHQEFGGSTSAFTDDCLFSDERSSNDNGPSVIKHPRKKSGAQIKKVGKIAPSPGIQANDVKGNKKTSEQYDSTKAPIPRSSKNHVDKINQEFDNIKLNDVNVPPKIDKSSLNESSRESRVNGNLVNVVIQNNTVVDVEMGEEEEDEDWRKDLMEKVDKACSHTLGGDLKISAKQFQDPIKQNGNLDASLRSNVGRSTQNASNNHVGEAMNSREMAETLLKLRNGI